MKNKLLYYYDIYVSLISQKGDNYYFLYKNDNYVLYKLNRALDDLPFLYELSVEMNNNNIKCHKILLTKENSITVNFNNTNYVLMKFLIKNTRLINFNDILLFNYVPSSKIISRLNKSIWGKLWEDKIDYFEYQFIQMKNKHDNINDSIHYYIGLWENAISYFNNIDDLGTNNLFVCHKRIYGNSSLIDFYNPLNFVVDYKERDIGDYMKSLFFLEDKALQDVFLKLNLKYINIKLLMTRLLFPSYYFDLYEKIVNDNLNDRLLDNVIVKQGNYEKFLNDLFVFYQKYNVIPIEWLKKKN